MNQIEPRICTSSIEPSRQNAKNDMNYCDIHTHIIEFPPPDRRRKIVRNALDAKLELLLSATAKQDEWLPTIDLADGSRVFAAIGVHPFYVDEFSKSTIAEMESLALRFPQKIRALGEIGLDFFDPGTNVPRQREALAAQLESAKKLGLPVILHNRKSWPDFFGVVRDLHMSQVAGVCHCFNGSREIAKKCLDLGLHLSFGPPITYANAQCARKIAAEIPNDRILAETDSPFMHPPGLDRDYGIPADVVKIVETIAKARKTPVEKMAETILGNAKKLLFIDICKMLNDE